MQSERIQEATRRLLCALGDPLEPLQGIDAAADDYVLAHCIRIGTGVISKMPSALPRVRESLEALSCLRLSPLERLHRQAGEAWLRGDPVAAIAGYESIVARDPRDLLALRLALSCSFFVGDHRRSCDVVDAALEAARGDASASSYVFALASFAHAEVGDAGYGEWLGRRALSRDPSCPLGVHAVAHALAESGDSAAGGRWMREQRAHWSVPSRMRTHNAWHLAMFDLDGDRLAPVFSILDDCLLPAADRWPLEACDAVALVWRLVRAGIDVGGRWQRLSDAFVRLWQPGFWPYVDVHAAIAHGSAGEAARLQRLERDVAACAGSPGFAGERARRLTQPVLGALAAWLSGQPERARERLRALTGGLEEAGCSRAQIGVFLPALQNA